MTLHIIKLCVGVDSLEELADWQKKKLAERKRKKQPLVLQHVTRMTPKRRNELLDGGSLYWVIRGQIAARQKLIDLKPVTRDGVPHCAIVYDPELVPLLRRAHRPFQGWRYLQDKDAPPDVRGIKAGNLPEKLKQELAELGLL
ncbi:MAG TPA: DUF1489 domain-containing protein [Rhizomicrobium sp.]|jgi:hypothetical protein|nr:DUF1489 domain-containing protein [Rhizomicrobium sp.]